MAEPAAPLSDAGAATLRAYLDGWLELQTTQLQPSTWSSYQAVLERYVLAHLGDVALADLDGRTLTRLYQQLLRAGGRDGRALSLRTVRYVHQILRKALSDGVRDGVLAANPADRAMLPKLHPERADELGDDPEVTAWSAAELRVFLAATESGPRHPLAHRHPRPEGGGRPRRPARAPASPLTTQTNNAPLHRPVHRRPLAPPPAGSRLTRGPLNGPQAEAFRQFQ